jgi:four helix bundle protein
MDLVEATYKVTEGFPERECYGITNQLRRAAVSVASNVAEGHARSTGDFIRHLSISSGSLAEMETQFMLSKRLGYLSGSDEQELLNVCEQVGRMLGRLRKVLRSRRESSP